MEDINLYDLAFAFNRRREVADANVVDGMCANDTVLVKFTDSEMAAFGMQDGYPAVVLGALYADDNEYKEGDTLEEGIYHDFEGDTDYMSGVADLIAQCEPEPDMETVLALFDRHNGSDSDYIAAHWRETVDVYRHGGSMLDLDNIVRLETIFGVKVNYDAYHRVDSEVDDLEDWLETGLTIREKIGE